DRTEHLVDDDTEHGLRHVVVRCQLVLPVGDVAPLLVLEERPRRHIEGVGVVERAAADPRAGEKHHVRELVDPLDAVAADLGCPEVLAHVPRRRGEVLVLEALAGLEHEDGVPLLGEAQSGHRPTEAGADDDDVVVGLLGGRAGGRGDLVGRARDGRRPAVRGGAQRAPSGFMRRLAVVSVEANISSRTHGGGPEPRRYGAVTFCGSVYFAMPSGPCRRPTPESFIPPIGEPFEAQAAAYASLMLTVPACSLAAI